MVNDHIEVFSNQKRIAVIGSNSVDWHKIPKTTERLKEKIRDVIRGNDFFDNVF
jgi:hypothetical protein